MIGDEIIRPEPYGHLVPESKLERYWAQNAGLVDLRRRRVAKFDPHAGISYFPMEYVSRSIHLRNDMPSDAWIATALGEFVRTEYAERRSIARPPCWRPSEVEEIETPDSFLDILLQNSGDELAGIIHSLDGGPLSKDTSPEGMARTIHELLAHPLVGSKKNRDNVAVKEFVEKVAPSIAAQERLLFVLPAFPFKDQNRFRVCNDADQPDLAELAFMIRLYRLTQVLYQVHPFGVDVLVLTDGDLYHRIFGISSDKVRGYADKLRAYRTRLNLHGTVSFVSLSDLIERASKEQSPKPNAHSVIEHIRARLRNLAGTTSELAKAYEVLVSAMKWNYESRSMLKNLADADAWDVLTAERVSIRPELLATWDDMQARAEAAAFEYASVNLALRWLDLIAQFFPDAIRGTIHPKPGQFALFKSGGTFPWNGMPWSDEWPRTIDDFEVRPYFALGSCRKVRKVTVRMYGNPCFYTKATVGRNVIAAREVFPQVGWELDGIAGRPFRTDDVKELIALGAGDKSFAWERRAMGANYYQRILQFRIEHYEKHGFGVQGMWADGKLIGQCGLQVLSEPSDQVEFVVFLGQASVRRGLGLKLMKHAMRRCAAAGMRSIYGVARPENSGALALLRKVGAKPVRSQIHFGYIASVFEIPLIQA